jgi:hypothetical protein
VLSALRLLEAEPSLTGMSQNFLAVAQLPGPPAVLAGGTAASCCYQTISPLTPLTGLLMQEFCTYGN